MKKLVLSVLCLTALTCVLISGSFEKVSAGSASAAPETQSRAAYLIDVNSGEVLFKSNENDKRPIASMVKIMTMQLIFEALENGKTTLTDSVSVSENASSMGGSQAFLDAGQSYPVETLLKSIVIASANDSCVALAEHLEGSVENFVSKMNEKALALGMNDTVFVNCTGLPTPGQFSTAKDVATMLKDLIKYSKYFEYSKIWMEDLKHPKDGRVTGLTNTNKLVRFYDNCDGGKTGFTSEAGHCLAATAKRGDTRLISVVIGAPDSKTRFSEVSGMFNYGFSNFESKIYLAGGKIMDEKISVRGGKKTEIEVMPEAPLVLFGKKGASKGELVVEFDSVKAPLKAGDKVGIAYIKNGGDILKQVNIVAAADVESKGYFDYIRDYSRQW